MNRMKRRFSFAFNKAIQVKVNRRQMIISCISLALATLTLVTSVFSWYYLSTGRTHGNFTVNVPNGLRLNYSEDKDSSVIRIQDDMMFTPISSADGQNLYIPTDDTFSDETHDQTYRCASAADKNFYFLQFDFSLTSYTDGTEVFIDAEHTYIHEHDNSTSAGHINAMRVAFVYDNGNGTCVMNPSDSLRKTDAVDIVNFGTGECNTTADQVSQPFKYYTATAGNSLFTMSSGETQTLSVVIWLEGSDPDCTNAIIGKNLDINIQFTTTWDSIDTIEFYDETDGNWISNIKSSGTATLQLISADESDPYNLENASSPWMCRLPKTSSRGITFKLTDGNNIYIWDHEPTMTLPGGQVLNGDTTTIRGANTEYHARGAKPTTPDETIVVDGVTKNIYYVTGYWKTGDGDYNDVNQDLFDDEDDLW